MKTLRQRGPTSRAELCDLLDLSRTTVSELTNELLQRGAIQVLGTDADQRKGSGRPAEQLAIDPSAGQFVGVDIGLSQASFVVADAAHEVITRGDVIFSGEPSWTERVDKVLTGLAGVMQSTGKHLSALQSIGVGIPSSVLFSNDRRHVVELIRKRFSQVYRVDVLVDSNTRLAALGEASKGRDSSSLIYLKMASSIGGGIVIDGNLICGSHGQAGDFGHAAVAGAGQKCRCDKVGCLETVASVPAIVAACRDAGVAVNNLPELTQNAKDPAVVEVLDRVALALLGVLQPVAVAVDVDEVVLGGDIVTAVPHLLDSLQAGFASVVGKHSPPQPKVRAASVSDGGAMGALAALYNVSNQVKDSDEDSEVRTA